MIVFDMPEWRGRSGKSFDNTSARNIAWSLGTMMVCASQLSTPGLMGLFWIAMFVIGTLQFKSALEART